MCGGTQDYRFVKLCTAILSLLHQSANSGKEPLNGNPVDHLESSPSIPTTPQKERVENVSKENISSIIRRLLVEIFGPTPVYLMKRYELSFETGRGKSFLEWLDQSQLYKVKELPLKSLVTLFPQMEQTINAEELRIFIDIVDTSKSANAYFFSDDEELDNFFKEDDSNCESNDSGIEVKVQSKSKDIDHELTKSNVVKIVCDLLKWLIKHGLSNGCEIETQGESKHCNKLEDMEKTKARPYCEIKPGIHGFRETPPTLEKKVTELEKKLKTQEYNHKKTVQELQEKNNNLKEEVANLKDKLQEIEEERRETLLQLGHVTIEKEKLLNEKKRDISFNKTFRQNVINVSSGAAFVSQQSLPSEASTSAASKLTIGAEALPKCTDQQTDDASISEKFSTNLVAAVSVQESREESRGREGVSLSNIPTTAVERSVYNNYKLLLLTIGDRLLSGDVAKLKDWAGRVHAVNVASDISEMFLELDRKGVISASNLEELRKFFGKILRVDLVHLIDCFLQGDYTHLRSTSSNRIPGNNSRVNSSYTGSTVSRVTDVARFPTWPTSESGNPRNSQLVDAKESFADKRPERQDSLVKLHSPVKNCRVGSFQAAIAKEAIQGTVVTDGSVPHDDDVRDGTGSGISQNNKTGGKSLPSRSPANHDRGSRVVMGSNGNKLSKFERPDSPRNRGSNPQDSEDDSDDDEQWLCSHYKRRCHVKFHCCDKYWPCHRCHNNESKCGQKKLKSRDTKFIKCVKCGKEQEFSGRSQFCIQCNAKFAKYFCPICKHLTGKDDKPYHCEKCGICRIHGDRSFHCDVCGVCLDVQLRGNHKCRAGSAHDECCICLEDAFTGCQILPCSHKVHKECATQMIRNGITRCPICRESFAHKLERRPIQPPKKHKGKKREPWP